MRLGRQTSWLVGGSLVIWAGCGGGDNDGAKPTPTVSATVTQSATAAPTASPMPVPCDLPPPFCGGSFPLNTAMTTAFGPAWADVTTSQDDFLPCFGPYALCYYADCTLSADGTVSDCPCYAWFGLNFVDINAILNADSYQATIAQCSSPGSCEAPNSAPVCGDINSGDFYGTAARRVSTFSFYLPPGAQRGLTDCSGQPSPYAGCMTAPCAEPTPNADGSVSIHCDCPIFDGPFQIGMDELCAAAPGQAWSAAYNPTPAPTDLCALLGGSCIPDAPPDNCGCPLYTSSTMLPADSGVDCGKVCEEYNGCLRTDTAIQLGYTCDATLCTSKTNALVLDACLGLEKCELSEIFKAEKAASCSCCASQLCNCDANTATENKIFELNAAQHEMGDQTQCEYNHTLCGMAP
jgi:hypothetical protein